MQIVSTQKEILGHLKEYCSPREYANYHNQLPRYIGCENNAAKRKLGKIIINVIIMIIRD